MINRLGDLALKQEDQWSKIHEMISNTKDYYGSEISKWVETDRRLKPEEESELIASYIKEARRIVEDIFFRGV